MSKKLKPCPFCGSETVIIYKLKGDNSCWVECKVCLSSSNVYNLDKEDDAISSWNVREGDNIAIDENCFRCIHLKKVNSCSAKSPKRDSVGCNKWDTTSNLINDVVCMSHKWINVGGVEYCKYCRMMWNILEKESPSDCVMINIDN